MNGKQNGQILLNPGNYKLPKPMNKKNEFKYFGYLIADDQDTAKDVFE